MVRYFLLETFSFDRIPRRNFVETEIYRNELKHREKNRKHVGRRFGRKRGERLVDREEPRGISIHCGIVFVKPQNG